MEVQLDKTAERRVQSPPRAGPPGLRLTQGDLEAYLEDLSRKGRVSGTLDVYRRNVRAFYKDLPPEKTVCRDTLANWQRALLEGGYSPRTVNARMSAANGLLDFLGRRDLQWVGSLEVDDVQPELSRTEYLRLLSTAKQLEERRLYMLVKLFGCTGIPVQELPKLTVEGLKEGPIYVRCSGTIQSLHVPLFLRRELLDFAKGEGILSGPLFRTKTGAPMGRSAVTDSIKRLCQDARVPQEKANPRCLKRLWQTTQDSIRAQIDLLVEQACDRLMENEQISVAWDVGKEVSAS